MPLVNSTKYIEAKSRLNPEQLDAVETIEGPVMVLAGPGTGKTQVLTLRIAEILARQDVQPSNIVALTFTESAANEMSRRLFDLIGREANGVFITTFHGLANAIVKESGINFSRHHALQEIDDLTRLELIITSIDTVNSPKLRPSGQPEKYVRDVGKLISDLKREGVTPERLHELINQTCQTIERDDGHYRAGKLMEKWRITLESYDRTRAFADVYAAYQSALMENGWYDYDDMILFVLRAFAEDPELKLQYQERFLYILVDEYQDTNSAQNALVKLLADFFADTPNVFVVGDDKQSIYRFQGASVANLRQFIEWYPACRIISLKQNYRSFQFLLDIAGGLISRNTTQLAAYPGLQSVIQSLEAHNSWEGDVAIHSYDSADAEVLGVTEKIQSLLADGVSPHEIAVLYRRNSEAARFIEVFERVGIPYLEAQRDHILYDRDIRQLRVCLDVASNPRDSQALFFYLHSGLEPIVAEDLLTLTIQTHHHRTSLYEFLRSEHFRDLELISRSSIEVALEKVERWYERQFQYSIAETVEYILHDSGILAALLASPDSIDRLTRLRAFYTSTRAVGQTTHRHSLRILLDKIALREKYNLTLSSSNESTTGCLRLMTAHKSKGLEFDVVFLTNASEKVWGEKKERTSIVLPEGIIAADGTADPLEEERRLFFVAMTRARKRLLISYPETGENDATLRPSPFIDDMVQYLSPTPVKPEKLSVATFFLPPQALNYDAAYRARVGEIVERYAVSPTSLNTYLQCPQLFLYQNILRIPAERTGSQAYGEAIHSALEFAGRALKNGEALPTFDAILDQFHGILERQSLHEKEVESYYARGREALQSFYTNEMTNWTQPLDVEYDFSPHNVKLDGLIPITGKLDRIEAIPGSNQVRVVDFKTGSIRSRNAILGKTAEKDEDYLRQLKFYAVLAETDPHFPYKVGEVALTFIDNIGKSKTESFVLTREEIDDMKNIIRHVRSRMLEQDFVHTPHKKHGWEEDGPNLCDRLAELQK